MRLFDVPSIKRGAEGGVCKMIARHTSTAANIRLHRNEVVVFPL